MAGEPVKFSVKLSDSSGAWFRGETVKMNKALNVMGNMILKNAQMVAPRKNNRLVNSARLVSGNDEVTVIFGGGNVPYAGYQERGERFDGSHKVRHYTSPGTGAHYLEKTGKAVTERGIRWFLSHS